MLVTLASASSRNFGINFVSIIFVLHSEILSEEICKSAAKSRDPIHRVIRDTLSIILHFESLFLTEESCCRIQRIIA